MKERDIRELQSDHGYDRTQELIDNGMAWRLEGSVGRECMRAIKAGACFLPKKRYQDVYGNTVPARMDVQWGSQGSLKYCSDYWNENE